MIVCADSENRLTTVKYENINILCKRQPIFPAGSRSVLRVTVVTVSIFSAFACLPVLRSRRLKKSRIMAERSQRNPFFCTNTCSFCTDSCSFRSLFARFWSLFARSWTNVRAFLVSCRAFLVCCCAKVIRKHQSTICFRAKVSRNSGCPVVIAWYLSKIRLSDPFGDGETSNWPSTFRQDQIGESDRSIYLSTLSRGRVRPVVRTKRGCG